MSLNIIVLPLLEHFEQTYLSNINQHLYSVSVNSAQNIPFDDVLYDTHISSL